MKAVRSVLHLVRGDSLPVELRDARDGDTVVFLGTVPGGDLPQCRLLKLGAASGPVDGIVPGALLELIFECESVVTW